MHSKTRFTVKKLVLAMTLASCTIGSAWAVLTPSTGTIQGTTPIASSTNGTQYAVDLSTNATGSSLATGDTVTVSYIYNDAEGDMDLSVAHINWFYVKDGTETDITTAANFIAASSIGGTGSSTLTIPAAAVGSVIKVVVRQVSQTGDPREGEAITIEDVSSNTSGGESTVPPGVVIPGGNMTPGIYHIDDSGFTTNLIGAATNLKVGETYVFRVTDQGGNDLTTSVSYNWRLTGTSATTNTTAPAEGFDTGTTDANYTVPANTAAFAVTGSADGVQGFSLAVDYE
ncbi:SinI family autotransporter-associated protein [Enterobacter hormaechei]